MTQKKLKKIKKEKTLITKTWQNLICQTPPINSFAPKTKSPEQRLEVKERSRASRPSLRSIFSLSLIPTFSLNWTSIASKFFFSAMTWSLAHLASALIILYSSSFTSISAVDLFQDSTTPRRPMILPLYLSNSNTSDHLSDHYRRQLQNSAPPHSANARMRLYDDLLSNGFVFLKKKFNSQFICSFRLLILYSFLLLLI